MRTIFIIPVQGKIKVKNLPFVVKDYYWTELYFHGEFAIPTSFIFPRTVPSLTLMMTVQKRNFQHFPIQRKYNWAE